MRTALIAIAGMTGMLACSDGARPPAAAEAVPARTLVIRDTVVAASFEVAGIAAPVQRSVLSTKLLGRVTRVLVQEGDRVRQGALLAQIDAREVDARRAQVEANVASAEAVYQDAATHAARIRALYAESAATRYQVDQVETGLARAEAGLRAAQASGAELTAIGDYADIRAPYAGLVTRRFTDPGAFVAPGAPVIELQQDDRLRLTVTVPPAVAGGLRAGQVLDATVEGRALTAIIEGSVPAPAGAVYTVNALVANPAGQLLAGSAATLRIPQGERRAILVPVHALHQEGDLTGVRVRTAAGSDLRVLQVAPVAARPGESAPSFVEVLAGLQAGDVILLGSD